MLWRKKTRRDRKYVIIILETLYYSDLKTSVLQEKYSIARFFEEIFASMQVSDTKK